MPCDSACRGDTPLPASYGWMEADSMRIAAQCENALGLEPAAGQALHERLWRGFNLEVLPAALGGVVTSCGAVRQQLQDQVSRDSRAIRGGIRFEQARSRQRLSLLERIAVAADLKRAYRPPWTRRSLGERKSFPRPMISSGTFPRRIGRNLARPPGRRGPVRGEPT